MNFNKKHLTHYKDLTLISAIKKRKELACLHLPEGNGFELGALYWPTPLSENHSVCYVDRPAQPGYDKMAPPRDQSSGFIEINMRVDIFNNIHTASANFVIANHVLEHVPSPLWTLNSLTEKLLPGGVLMLSLPDASKIYDAKRPRAKLEDFICATAGSAMAEAKIIEYLVYAEGMRKGADISARQKKIIEAKEDPHLWTFDRYSFMPTITEALDYNFSDMDFIAEYYNAPFEEMIGFWKKTK